MSEKLTRKDIQRAFSRNRGAAAELARDLGVSPVLVSQVLKGRATSERVMSAARERAVVLIEEERAYA